MKTNCEIATPQFFGSEGEFYMLRQAGEIDTETWVFTPHKSEHKGHKVYFYTQEQFNKAVVAI